MTDPQQPYGQQYDPYAKQGYDPQPYPSYDPYAQQPAGYGQQPYAQQPGYGQPQPGFPYGQPFGPDPAAPYGRDPQTGEPYSDKSKLAAGLLQIFLGGWGIGRFYLGSTSIAVTQLVLTVIGIVTSIILIGFVILIGVGIWALVDGIMILTGSVRDAQGRPLRP